MPGLLGDKKEFCKLHARCSQPLVVAGSYLSAVWFDYIKWYFF